jgi:Secretion system C-terminal sorting domain
MKKNLLLLLILKAWLFLNFTVSAQTFPCNGDFLFTRQITPSPNSYVSNINFIPNDINITNPGTIAPAVNTNSSVQYNGYIWTQLWGAAAYTLLRVDAAYNTTPFIVAGMPAVNQNNAGVDKNGIMYILQNTNSPANLYAINLSSGTPVAIAGFPKLITGLTAGESALWGDISIDPTNNRVYCWYHPNPAATSNLRGLYEITNISGASPIVTKVGTVGQDYIMGSLFFNDRGQLFGYGSPTVTAGSVQERFFAIDKANGLATQYGLPDLPVTQTDGCECAFRISLDRQVSTPILNIPKCGIDTFNYVFTPRNYSNGAVTNITFSDTLDTRLSYAFNAAALQTQLQAVYGGAVIVTVGNDGGGINNAVNITGMDIPVGQNSFTLPVRTDATKFNNSFTSIEQAYLKGIAINLGGPNEPSNNPTTFNSKDATPITINLSGTKCLPPVADNFINTPMPQGNGATVIPALVAADPDGTITNYTITSVPTAVQGVLSIPCPPTPAGAACVGSFADLTPAVLTANGGNIMLTPAQIAAMRFDPTANFTGNAQFTFTATDNSGNISNTATYVLPVIAQPPVSNNLMENSMVNTNGPTAIKPLNSADVDGIITSYRITSVPAAIEGVISIPCPPIPTSATCAGSFANLTPAVLAANPGGIILTPTQMAGMRFDPAAGFTGNATFNYDATDNSGNISNSANYTIPVSATVTVQRPPLADNITAQTINNSLGATAIPPLKASDLDGTVVSYTITSVPPASQGILSVACPPIPAGAACNLGFADLTPAVLAVNGGNIVLTPAQINTMRFDPAPGFIGNATFNYFATDNNSLVSNPATHTIPVVNTPPTAVNINTVAPFNGPAAPIVPLSGSDADGIVTVFTVTTVPTAAQGVLSIPCPPVPTSATCNLGFADLTPAVLAANPGGIALTPAQAAGLRFDPAVSFSGAVPFTYTTTDNNNLVSSPATYIITIANQPPISNDITIPVIPNTNGVTAINPLSSTDPDGTIANYTISSIPAPTSGTLSIPCPPLPTGATCNLGFADITAAVMIANPGGITLTAAQMASMRFDPAANYTGVVNFTYSATDNSGNVSNVATYNIPISGVGNLPPVAQNIIIAAMPATNGVTAITNLVGIDPDGTIASYTITAVPPANEGVLSVSCPPTPAGATCAGFFANLTPAVLAANPNGIVLTPAQISTLRFDPDANFTGTVTFTYFDTDNSGAVSNLATYTIPVTGTPPVSNPVVAPAMPQTNGPTTIPGLVSSDADGTIASYQIDALPPASQGVLSILCPPTPGGATCTGGFADLTAAVLAANPGGISLTALQMAVMRFDPAGGYSGNVVFNYHATDNSGLISNTTTYTIPVSGQPPVSSDILAPKLLNTSGPTAIPGLISTDPDGTIANYIITGIPPVSQGVLSIPCPPTPGGATCIGNFADLTAAVLAANPGGISLTAIQMAGMRFDPDATYNGDVIFNYAAYDNNGNLSNVAAYIIPVGSPAVLPITSLKFTGARSNDNIVLTWETENEINIGKYEIQYSNDGLQFLNGGFTVGKNMAVNSYQFTLQNFMQPLYYIRLKIIDADGSYKYSNTIVIRNNGNRKNSIIVYPAPAVSFINIEMGALAKGDYNFQLIDAAGKIAGITTVKNVQANQLIKIDRNNLAAGIYMLKITSKVSNETVINKIIFQ